MATIPTLTTAEEFETICGQVGPCELVRGEILHLSPGGLGHSSISGTVAGLLFIWARRDSRGRVLTNEAGIVVEVGPDTVRGADVAYLSYQRLPKGKRIKGFLKVPPELVVEILGKGQGWRDMVEKAGEYLRMGVDRVWVIDPDAETLHIFRSDAEPIRLTTDDQISDSGILPGFSCKVAEIFND
jgi:Uma2 family endonuclease